MTGQEAYSIALDIIKEQSDNAVPAFQEDRALSWVNWLRDEWFNSTELLRKTAKVTTPASTALSATYSGTTTMSLDSVTGFDGVFYIGEEIGYHTGTAALTLTGVSNVNKEYATDVAVTPLYKLPNIVSIHDFKILGQTLDADFVESEDGKFLKAPASSTVEFTYSYLPTALTSLTEELKIQSPYDYYIVYGLIKLWKEVMESTTDTSLESARMAELVNAATTKRMLGRNLRISTFNRYKI